MLVMDGPLRAREMKLCTFCDQELSHAAYYRHLQDSSGVVCPGKKDSRSDDSSQSSDDMLSVASESDFSCGQDLLSSDEHSVIATNHEPVDFEMSEAEQDSVCDSSVTDSDIEGEEIWESCEDDDDHLQSTNIAQRILYGIALFVTKFQLLFKISERAMSALLLFLGTIITFLAHIIKHPLLTELYQLVPKTMWSVKNIIGTQHIEGVIDYVVCPKCHSLFSVSDCSKIEKEKRLFLDKNCDHIEYPNHPHRSRRVKCGTPLMKRVKVKKGTKFVPRKLYHYHSIVDSLKQLIKKQTFLKDCEHWRRRVLGDNVYADVYDGRVWEDLQHIDGSPFLAAPHNLCFMMNVDWFNPYIHSQYSAGAIYLTILNLPRAMRNKLENVLLVGLIPGPKEPSLNINSYLFPLIQDLRLLFQGVTFTSHNSVARVRALLCCVGSDLPATKKLCGFLSHSANRGCSKCMRSFSSSSFREKLDYSGFDVDNWEARKLEDHKKNAETIQGAATATSRASLEKQYGLRYSVLLCLPVFDVIRCHTIDPMHNIFLGIAKLCVKVWKDKEILKASDFDKIQGRVDSVVPPPNIGRIPRKIGSGFSAFTADEWKHWILIYSMFALQGILPERDYSCWFLFVRYCLQTCKLAVTKQEILNAHDLMVEFCTTFQQLYGTGACTPNLHMACHLKDSMLDYGPLPAFWCFSFERYNGILEGVCKSWITPEKQMFSKFLNLQYLNSLDIQHTHLPGDDFVGLIGDSLFQPSRIHSSVEQTGIDGLDIAQQMKNYTCEVSCIDASVKSYHKLSVPLVEKVFNDTDFNFLKIMYSHLYDSTTHEIVKVSRFYVESKHITINSLQLLSTKARSQRSAAIVAHWRNQTGIDLSGQTPVRVGIVNSFFRHDVHVRSGSTVTCKRNLLARVNWFENHPRQHQYIPSLMVTCTLYDRENCSNFIPVSRIAARCAIVPKMNVKFDYGEDSVCVCVPLYNGILV